MEKISISVEQENKLLSFLSDKASISIVFFIIGMSGVVQTGVTYFGDFSTNYYSSSTFIFFVIGLGYWCQVYDAKNKIKKGNYQVYRTDGMDVIMVQ